MKSYENKIVKNFIKNFFPKVKTKVKYVEETSFFYVFFMQIDGEKAGLHLKKNFDLNLLKRTPECFDLQLCRLEGGIRHFQLTFTDLNEKLLDEI